MNPFCKYLVILILYMSGCHESNDSPLMSTPSESVKIGKTLKGVKSIHNLISNELCTAFHITEHLLVTAAHCLKSINKQKSCMLAINGKKVEARCYVPRVSPGENEVIDSFYDLGLIFTNDSEESDPPFNELSTYPILKLKEGFGFGISGFGQISDEHDLLEQKEDIEQRPTDLDKTREDLGADMTGISDDDLSAFHPGIFCKGRLEGRDLYVFNEENGFILSPYFTTKSECIPRKGASGSPLFDLNFNLIGVAVGRMTSDGHPVAIYLARLTSRAFEDLLDQVVSISDLE